MWKKGTKKNVNKMNGFEKLKWLHSTLIINLWFTISPWEIKTELAHDFMKFIGL